MLKNLKNTPIGILSDVRRTSDGTIWIEVWGDEKRFTPLSTYCDDGNTVSGDGCWRHWCYSILVRKLKSTKTQIHPKIIDKLEIK